MSERVLKNRKKKKASKGRHFRVSDLVYSTLEKRRSNYTRKHPISWDTYFRTIFGLPKRNGDEQPLVEGWLETTTGQFYFDEAEANGRAVVEAAKAKTKRVNKPIRMREIK